MTGFWHLSSLSATPRKARSRTARAHFRNKDELIAILRKAVPTLDEFYTATRDKPQSKRIAHADGKVTL